ncbi:PGL/p-HBAD biosynthesis glycosyltransferase [Oxobacter pfennigii]|uniref:PGL/p-HBAD biosynthesis glycosyltransferase n=1 Tax=Oxobacter pfennigii TaxID=36849 RepID=A0A0P8W516_9CLOT|nr:glycosyltransferase family 2 protein [Oxobacter pfennigii]KPU43686.1 PGL/p-HBAD biosynthesis glycosyltransferase [Oxobacter pfennigii]
MNVSNVQKSIVSIITPSYNQAKYIQRTIESVLCQNYNGIEYIVVDGSSTDNTLNILKSYNSKLKYVSETDNGQANAVNKGIKIANGDIIGWLNSDDTYMPDTIKKVVEFFNTNNYDVIYGNAYFIDIYDKVTGEYPTESFDYKRLADRCYICQPTVFFRKSVIEDIGYLDESLHLCLDYELWIRMGKKYKFAYLNDILASSRIYPENKTLSRHCEVYAEAQKILYEHYGYIPLSWIKSKIFYDNPDYSNKKVIYESLKQLIKQNYKNPSIIVNELYKAFVRQIQGKVRWR